ncbi:hypothetical protein XFF6990_200397 [Xanthomonas citri pv. fuscans]|uniref:Uncharacterized protein n=1 Tax=Xanthomonas campestris pv. phaseoli TaxID=317013 RepID=A0A7Z7J1R2_XANCH|nr:hypothetical protein XFF6990_200397 [Xanthomonas citri pv. fuscans]SOO25631.1 hypothetical protein XFF6991_470024 [Xanthomonas phaseoli pv. phaseoli]
MPGGAGSERRRHCSMQHDNAGGSSAMAQVTRLLRDALATRIAAGSQGLVYGITHVPRTFRGLGTQNAVCEQIEWQYRRMHCA